MSVYSLEGNELLNTYAVDGTSLSVAYDVNGNSITLNLELKVMTYNVGGWYDGSGTNVPNDKDLEYYNLQMGMITQNDPDILVLQEYWSTFSGAGRSAYDMLGTIFPYVHQEEGGTYMGRCICSKFPILSYISRPYTQEPSRYFDSCKISAHGKELTVITTHLGLTQANRTPEILQLIEFLKEQERFICCGDYNTEISASTANTSSSEYIANVKPFVDEGFNTANFISSHFLRTYKGPNNEELYLDNIYTSSNIEILSAYVDETKINDGITDTIDHMPLIATLEIL